MSFVYLPVVGINAQATTAEYVRQMMFLTLNNQAHSIKLTLLPEPTNPFDANAIQVLMNQVKIGYIARDDQHYFDFSQRCSYDAQIVQWGVTQNNQAVFLYIMPYL